MVDTPLSRGLPPHRMYIPEPIHQRRVAAADRRVCSLLYTFLTPDFRLCYIYKYILYIYATFYIFHGYIFIISKNVYFTFLGLFL